MVSSCDIPLDLKVSFAPVMAHFCAYSNALRRRATPGMNGSGAVLLPYPRHSAKKKDRFGMILSSLALFL
jgi:hypothetical protein